MVKLVSFVLIISTSVTVGAGSTAASSSDNISGDYTPVLIPPSTSKAGPTKLILFVPGGKVPPADYVPFLKATMHASEAKLMGVIVKCGALNLCDPLGQLDGLIADAISAAGMANNNTFEKGDIIVMGHSLGGVGARHYFDGFTKNGRSPFVGLALLGTQFNGDHEDFKGTLGYPMDLGSFPAPLLSLTGELDMGAMSHPALLYEQFTSLSSTQQTKKPVVIIPGMDHSQFCSPFNVSGDIAPEISNAQALNASSRVAAAWLDSIVAPSGHTISDSIQSTLQAATSTTGHICAAFLAARALEGRSWCESSQMALLGSLPAEVLQRVKVGAVHTMNGSASFEHAHTNYSLAQEELSITVVAYPYYAALASWNPVERLTPTYMGADNVGCKMLSADRVAEQLNVTGQFPQSSPPVTCDVVNQAAVQKALALLQQSWPAAVERFHARGRNFTMQADSAAHTGPGWVFLSSLGFSPGSGAQPVVVQSPRLYSSITSAIFPGNMYCKLLSPAKAIEWIQTTGLMQRFK